MRVKHPMWLKSSIVGGGGGTFDDCRDGLSGLGRAWAADV